MRRGGSGPSSGECRYQLTPPRERHPCHDVDPTECGNPQPSLDPHPDVDLAKSSGQRLAFGDDAVIPLKEPLRRSLRSSSALATATVPTH